VSHIKSIILILFIGFILSGCNNDKLFSADEPGLNKGQESDQEIPIEMDEEETSEDSEDSDPDKDDPKKDDDDDDHDDDDDDDHDDDDDDYDDDDKKHPNMGDNDDDKKRPKWPPRKRNNGKKNNQMAMGCSKAAITNIKLYITEVLVKNEAQDFKNIIIEQEQDSIAMTEGFTFESPLDGEFKHAFVAIDISKSSVETSDGNTYPLQAPSHPHRILKLKNQKNIQLDMGQSYNLKLNITPEDNLVQNPVKCFLKPVVKNSELQED
jgi:hypothetical protein